MVLSKALYFKEKAQELNRYRSWRLGVLFVGCGLVLFGLVWWPIQAERARLVHRQWEEKIAQKKAEINNMNAHYKNLTSLAVLDKWAKSHGPWTVPTANDIITF